MQLLDSGRFESHQALQLMAACLGSPIIVTIVNSIAALAGQPKQKNIRNFHSFKDFGDGKERTHQLEGT
jgi:hypothetical protein